MLGLVCLFVGLLCAIIGRILLASAAFGISVWWGFGVFLPFGPLLFRLSYPEAGERSRMFRLATIPCLLLYFWLGPGVTSRFSHQQHAAAVQSAPAHPTGFALESRSWNAKAKSSSSSPVVEVAPNLDERRAANARELEGLRKWSEALRLRKRDLLHSDVEGNRTYNIEVAQYNAALEKATAERNALWPTAKEPRRQDR